MREDMFKVIVERPRRGWGKPTKSKLRYAKGGAPKRMSGKRIVTYYNGDTKFLNENLAPLKRYLHRQKGRRWDDVFSDICKTLDTGSTVKMHVREHIEDFIEQNVRQDAQGGYWAVGGWGGPQPPREWADLYVDPDDGIIKETAALCQRLGVPTGREYRKKKRAAYTGRNRRVKTLKRLSGTVMLVQKAGIWYRMELGGNPETARGYAYSDRELYNELSKSTWHSEQPWRVIACKQLSTKELKRHGLKNDMEAHYG